MTIARFTFASVLSIFVCACYATVGTSQPVPTPPPSADVQVEAAPATAAPATTPPPGGPIVCSGNESLALQGVVIDTAAGAAVQATGSCDLVLSGCTLRSGEVGVHASGNATVRLDRCEVSGGALSVHASGNADVFVSADTRLYGPTHVSGNADVVGF